MGCPYKVKVVNKGKQGINIQVDPPPIASEPRHAEAVTKRVTDVILHVSNTIPNTIKGRHTIKKQIESVLNQLHAQGMIVPKDH